MTACKCPQSLLNFMWLETCNQLLKPTNAEHCVKVLMERFNFWGVY